MHTPLPLTDSQHAMWLLDTISGRGELFNVAECLEFKGKISASWLQQSLQHVWQASDTLACRFIRSDDYTPQLLANDTVPDIISQELASDPEDVLTFAQNFAKPHLATPFDLSKDALMKLFLLRAPEQDYLLLVAHHLLLDGYGFGLFSQSLNRCYNALSKGKPLPKLRFTQQQQLLDLHNSEPFLAKQKQAKETLNQWLDEVPEVNSYSTSKADVAEPNKRLTATFEQSIWHTIQSAAQVTSTTSSEILLAAIAASLVAQHQQYHVTLGLVMMNRQAVPELSCPCVQSNVLPLPLALTPNTDLSTAATLINSQIKALKKVQSYRVESLKRDRQKQGKSLSIIGPTVNLLPFANAPKYGSVETISHILSAGTTDDIMLQIHLLADKPATVDFDCNVARYDDTDTQNIQARIFSAAKIWASQPKLMLSEVAEILRQKYL
ncbi:condensation domain-containing protein [Pseudoalteromonas luteoviolacea]|uniref:condensation domain-containing protein n=1 Tax=Pseudoalteromonas luteoviolacea TaxID=43657 RepID=UPI0011532856|nr:condensation domain-containing protein [Pseudoalteromonas luteoviolacea]TQF72401.1 ferric siderophore synthetase subunit F [Pseudoalteromonas luteoviolacea]